MRRLLFPLPLLFCLCCPGQQSAPTPDVPRRTDFQVRYVNGTDVYIDGGRDAGLSEGMALVLRQSTKAPDDAASGNAAVEPGVVAELKVVAVASASAVCEVTSSTRALAPGDTVSLPEKEVEHMVEKQALGRTRAYPMIVSFTEGDPLDEAVRAALPRPPLPEINEARGRIGFDISSIRPAGQGGSVSSVYGMVARMNISRIWGSHWNLNGFWRGSFERSSGQSQQSLQDLINRTYEMSLSYINPDSRWVAGVGRLYLPWASSLEVIDGGYFGMQSSHGTVTGVFGGSTPDPAAWNYAPNRQIAGFFFNIHGGDYEKFRYSSTTGAGIDLLSWSVNRPFVFTENDISWKRYLSVYHSMQIDKPKANPGAADVPVGLGQSFLSVQARVIPRVTLELNDTYFRDVPTFDPTLIGTGLLDKYLYQGLTGGARIEFPMHVTGYFNTGRSSTSTDAHQSWNLMTGVTVSRIWKTGMQIDARYSDFNSSYASGIYRLVTITRNLGDRLQLNMQGGRQNFTSTLATNNGSWFGNTWCDLTLGRRYFAETGYTTQRGGPDDYDQWTITLGYRFDNRAAARRRALVRSH